MMSRSVTSVLVAIALALGAVACAGQPAPPATLETQPPAGGGDTAAPPTSMPATGTPPTAAGTSTLPPTPTQFSPGATAPAASGSPTATATAESTVEPPAGTVEDMRLEFERGATGAVVTAELPARVTHRYTLRILAEQLIDVNVSPPGAVQLSIYGEDGTVLRSGMGEGSFFRGTVPSTQDYYVQLAAGPEPASYTLDVLIPERITFGAGATSATVQADLAALSNRHFVIRALAGQTMRVDVTPDAAVQTSIYGVDGTVLKSGMGGGPDFEAVLPSSQDYVINVRSGDRPVTFELTVTIE